MVQARCGAVDDRDDVCRRGATLEEHAVPGSKKPLKFSGNAFELGDLYSQARAGVPAFPGLARKRPRLTRGAFACDNFSHPVFYQYVIFLWEPACALLINLPDRGGFSRDG